MDTVSAEENVLIQIPHLISGVFNQELPEHQNTISFLLYSKGRCNRILDLRGHYPAENTERYLYDKVYVYINVFQLEGILVETEEEFAITTHAYHADMDNSSFDVKVYWGDHYKFCSKKTETYYDTVLDIYQQVLEFDEKDIHLLVYIIKDETNLSLLQDFLDLVTELQKEFEFNLTIDIQTDVEEVRRHLSEKQDIT